MTRAQEFALANHWAQFGCEYRRAQINLEQLFGRDAPCVLDIGCGMGQATLTLAKRYPQRNFLAIEVHRPGVGSLLHGIVANNLHNIRVLSHDSVEVIRDMLPSASIEQALVYFPDPWPKKRHHKRRLLNADFARRLHGCMQNHGRVYIATDWADYAEQIPAAFEANGYTNLAGTGRPTLRPHWRPLTKFEQRGLRLGHAVFDFVFRPMRALPQTAGESR